jgi:hypothetical protein
LTKSEKKLSKIVRLAGGYFLVLENDLLKGLILKNERIGKMISDLIKTTGTIF